MIVRNQRQLGEKNLKYAKDEVAKDEVGVIINNAGNLSCLGTPLHSGWFWTTLQLSMFYHMKAKDIAGNVYSVEEGGAGENQVILAI